MAHEIVNLSALVPELRQEMQQTKFSLTCANYFAQDHLLQRHYETNERRLRKDLFDRSSAVPQHSATLVVGLLCKPKLVFLHDVLLQLPHETQLLLCLMCTIKLPEHPMLLQYPKQQTQRSAHREKHAAQVRCVLPKQVPSALIVTQEKSPHDGHRN